MDSQRPASVPFAFGMTALGLLIGYLIKSQCVVHPWSNNYQYTHFCYNEIQALFAGRGIRDGLIPYIDTRFEYPVLTGMFMDLAGRVLRALVAIGIVRSNSDTGYLAVSAIMLAPFSFIATALLRPRVTRARLMIWAIGSPTIFFTFHNWDLLAVCAAVWGMVSLEKARLGTSGSAFAVGASAKLFPAFLMPGAVLSRWAARDSRGALRLIAGFAVTYLVINVPWILVSGGPASERALRAPSGVELRQPGTNGWLEVWKFHAGRPPDYWTVWYWIPRHVPAIVDRLGFNGYKNFVGIAGLAFFALGSLWILRRGWKRRTEPQGYPVVAVGLAVVALFLLTSKVYSPQYALWVVPMLAMLDIDWRLVFAYLAAELAVLICGFYWFTVIDKPESFWLNALEVTVWLRAMVLVLVVAGSLRTRRLIPVAQEEA